MSYDLDFVIAPVPKRKGQAWDFLEDLQTRFEDDRSPPHPLLRQLHDVLVARFPDDDLAHELCPWAHGPLIKGFAREMGMVAIRFGRSDVVQFAIDAALALGITVMDGQEDMIHRPT